MKIEIAQMETVSPMLARLVRRADDLGPVMRLVRSRIMAPAARSAWQRSGLHSISGELRRAVTPFAGKRSAGVGLRYTPGKSLVWPKAVTHTEGLKKFSNKRRRRARGKGSYFRRSPWGDIPARPFIPTEADILAESAAIAKAFAEHFHVAAE